MKELRVMHNSVGRYNLFGTEESFIFSMAIYEDGVVYAEGEMKCIATFSGEVDDADTFEDTEGNMHEIIGRCFEYCSKVLSTWDYKGQCNLFLKTYLKYFDEINESYRVKEEQRITKEIERLTKQLEQGVYGYGDKSDLEYVLQKRIDSINKSIQHQEGEKKDLKELSESWLKVETRISELINERQAYTDILSLIY